MSEGRTNIGELKVKRETTYAQTEGGSFSYMRAVKGSFKPDLRIDGESLPDERIVPTIFEEEEHVLGSQYGGKFDVEVYGEGLATPLVAAAVYGSPSNGMAIMARAAMGGSFGAEGSLVEAAGTTTSAVEHSAGDEAFFAPHSVIGVTTLSGPGGTAAIECAVVRKKTGAVLSLYTTLASVPIAGSEILNSETMYVLPTLFGGDGESLYCEWVGENSEDQFKMRGCVPSMKIISTIRQHMKLAMSVRVNQATRVNSLVIDRTAPVGGHPLPVVRRSCYFGTNADADAVIARTILQLEESTIDPGIEIGDESGGGQETLYRLRMRDAKPTAEVLFRLARSSAQYAAFYTERAANTKKYFHQQVGDAKAVNGRGGIVFMALPRCRYDMHIGRTDADGFSRARVQLGATRPRSASGGTQAIMDSAMLLAVL